MVDNPNLKTSTAIVPSNIRSLSPVSHKSLEEYIGFIMSIPMLPKKQEYFLAVRYRDTKDAKYAEQLILPYMKLVVKIAKQYSGYSISLADLIQEGTVGLILAIQKFDPDKKILLATFSQYWIRGRIIDYIIRNDIPIKYLTTPARKNIFLHINRTKEKLRQKNMDTSVENIARELSVSNKEVQITENIMQSEDSDKTDYNGKALIQIPDNSADPISMYEDEEKERLIRVISNIVMRLDERSRDIIINRYFGQKKTSLQTLARKYNISLERIRQIENDAIITIQSALKGSYP